MKKEIRNKVLKQQMKIAEDLFGTLDDPDQIPINKKSVEKLDTLSTGWIESELDNQGNPISWSVVVPTQKEIAVKFLNREITERELFNLTEPEDEYSALYLASLITVPKHRGKGLAFKTLKKNIENIPLKDDALLFTWPITEDGKNITHLFSEKLGKKVAVRK